MPFFIAIVGIILLVAAIRGQVGTLFSLIKSDFTGSGNFLYWVVAILVIGSIGYVKKLQPVSDAFLALVMVVFVLSNKGFFNSFMQGLSQTGNCPSSNSSTPVQPGLGANVAPNMNAPLSAPSSIPGLSNFGAGVLQMQGIGM